MRPFPIDRVRREFPALSRPHHDKPRVFMDNPAGTQLPRRVIEAVPNAMVDAAINDGSFFETSHYAEAVHARAHGAMADFVNGRSPDENRGGAEHDRADSARVEVPGGAGPAYGELRFVQLAGMVVK